MTRSTWQAGDYRAVPLPGGGWGAARLLELPNAAFLDLRQDEPPAAEEPLAAAGTLFTIGVSEAALERWPATGVHSTEHAGDAPPRMFMQDLGDPRSCEILEPDGASRPATPDECVGLERLAVWSATQAEERLADALAGRPNAHADRMRVQRP